MRRRTLIVMGLMTAVIAAIAAIAVVLVRSDDSPSEPRPSTPAAAASSSTTLPPAPTQHASPDIQAAENAARDGLTVAYTWYPSTDSGPRDAFARARTWLSAALAARVLADARAERGPGIEWGRWASEHTEVVAEVTLGCSGCPDDTPTQIARVATIRQTAVTGEHVVAVAPDTVAWVTMIKDGDRWLIDTIRY
ncbi:MULTISPECIES: hypothetical protein [unclassified Nocardia]|uniref:hypothetical protein n=1 Tax=unclassified Nocardia TaxID=2637762 RepID=UPI001CE44278|nr:MULTISPECIES: hypothetical protein [unclassified Nocardia]